MRPQDTIFKVHCGRMMPQETIFRRSCIACGGGARAICADVRGKGGHEVDDPAVPLRSLILSASPLELRHDVRVLQAPPG